MISAADFADVFPSMAEQKQKQHRDFRQQIDAQYDRCLARWEDDGGRGHHRPFGVSSSSPEPTCATHIRRDPLEDALFLLVPTLTILWASWLFSGYARGAVEVSQREC